MSDSDDNPDDEDAEDDPPVSSAPEIAVDSRVRVRPGSPREVRGVVVEDYGNDVGHPVEIGEHRIADAARRWAVVLDDGGLVFVDDDDLVAE